MSLIEFQTYVHEGMIELPKAYQDQIKGRVRVIILTPDEDDEIDMIEFLMEHPLEATDAQPLTRDEIYDRG